jgi:hypothetical protein
LLARAIANLKFSDCKLEKAIVHPNHYYLNCLGVIMKALKVMAMIDDQGQLTLDYPLLTDRNSRVEVIVLIPEEKVALVNA